MTVNYDGRAIFLKMVIFALEKKENYEPPNQTFPSSQMICLFQDSSRNDLENGATLKEVNLM